MLAVGAAAGDHGGMAAHTRPLLALGLMLGIAAVGVMWSARGSDADAVENQTEALVLGPQAESVADLSEIDGVGLADGSRSGQRSGVVERTPDGQLPRVTLDGVVFGGLRGLPVEGAQVILADTHGQAHTSTDAEGRFSMSWSRPNPGLRVEHPEFVDLRRPQVEFEDEFEVRLQSSGSVQGRLISLGGALPSKVSVHLWTELRGKRSEEPSYSSQIDGQFRYRLLDVTPGTYAVGIAEPGLPVVVRAGVVVQAGHPTFEDLELPAGSTVSGRVVEGVSKRPLSNVHIRFQADVQGLASSMEQRASVETTTVEDGTFSMDGVPTGQVVVWSRTEWGHRQRSMVNTVEGQVAKPLLIVIAAPATLSGRVLDMEGKAQAGALVVRCLEDEMTDFTWARFGELDLADERLSSVACDSEGRFDFGQVPSRQKLFLRAYPPAGDGTVTEPLPVSKRLALKPGEVMLDLLFQLTAGHPVEGTVWDASGMPLAGVEVGPRIWIGRGLAPMGPTQTDAAGRFRFSGLPEGPLHLLYGKEGYLEMRQNYTVSAEMPAIEVSMTPAFRLSGVIVDAEGYAIPDGVAVARFGEPKSKTRRFSTVDEWGRFELDGLQEGTWYVSAAAPGWQFPDEACLALQIPGAAPVHLIMTPRPPPAPATVTGELRMADTGEPVPGLRFNDLRRGAVKISGTRFSIQGMRPGRLALLAFGEGAESYTYPRIDLQPGMVLDLGSAELRRTTSLSVRLFGPDGVARRKADVVLQRLPVGEGGRPTGSRQIHLGFDKRSGAFISSRVPRYKWQLVVKVPGLDTHMQTLSVKGGKQTLDVHVKKKAKSRKKGKNKR